MKTSATPNRKSIVKRRIARTASSIGAGFAATAVICAAFSPTISEAVALCGVTVDVGTRVVLKFIS